MALSTAVLILGLLWLLIRLSGFPPLGAVGFGRCCSRADRRLFLLAACPAGGPRKRTRQDMRAITNSLGRTEEERKYCQEWQKLH